MNALRRIIHSPSQSTAGQIPVRQTAPQITQDEITTRANNGEIRLDSENKLVSVCFPGVRALTAPEVTLVAEAASRSTSNDAIPANEYLEDHDSNPADHRGGGDPPQPPGSNPALVNFIQTKDETRKDSKTLWALGIATATSIVTSFVVHLTDLLGDFKKPIGLISDSVSIFLGTCFGAGLLSQRNEAIDAPDHSYQSS